MIGIRSVARNNRCIWQLLAALAVMQCAVPASVAQAQTAKPVVNGASVRQDDGTVLTRRTITLADGKRLTYTARAGFIPLRENVSNELRGEIFFVAYTADQGKGEEPRPLTFKWGGGPGGGAALSPEGPRRLPNEKRSMSGKSITSVKAEGGHAELIDNRNTWLAFTDLVLIDAMGTGYSRMAKPEFAALFYNPQGDAESLAEFMRIYLKRYDRREPPIFLTGGSYGSIRSALVAEKALGRDIPIRGLILSAVAFSMGFGPLDLGYTSLLPSFTVAAYVHKKLPADLQSKSMQEVLREAEEFTDTEYTTALARGNRMTEAQRKQIVSRLARFTGLDEVVIERSNLRVAAAQFGNELLRSEQRDVGLYDSRLAAPSAGEAWDPTTDPSLQAVGGGAADIRERVLTDELGITTDVFYSGPFGGGWPTPMISGPSASTFPNLGGDAMFRKWTDMNLQPAYFSLLQTIASHPEIHVLLTNGFYDLMTPYYGSNYVASRVSPEHQSQFTLLHIESGHDVPKDGPEADRYRQGVADFIRKTLRAPGAAAR
jgi:carboxypeptidase C (cathepsin A)